MKNRKLWNMLHALHLYSGLVIGAFLVLIALTGSIIAFNHEIDRALNPELLTVKPGGERRSLSEIVTTAKAVYPDKPLAFIRPPDKADDVYVAGFKTPKEGASSKSCCSGFNWFYVMLDPYTGKVTGQRDYSHYELTRPGFTHLMSKLHGNLLLGETGKTMVGLISLAWLILILIGVYLWWPGVNKIKMALSIKRKAGSARFIFDLHRAFGMYSLVVMVVLAFSGVYFIFPDYVKPMVAVFSPVSVPVSQSESASEPQPVGGQGQLTVDAAIDIGRARFPGAELKTVGLPLDDKGSYAITFRQAEEVKRPRGGKSTVWIDQYTGKLLAKRDAQKASGSDTFLNWQWPLHTGSAFGLTGRIIICLSGLICTLLVTTGTLVWLRKRRNKAVKVGNKEPDEVALASPQAQSA
jgi:uncharacterized iron-regulated membrane protein